MEKAPRVSAAREKIISAAAELFYRNGIKATGIDTVIEAADVARMTLYKYFPSKEALVEAVLRDRAEKSAASFHEAIDGVESPRERIIAIIDWHSRNLGSDDFRGCPFFNAVVENTDHTCCSFAVAVDAKSVIRRELLAALCQLNIRDPEELTEEIGLLLDGSIARAQMGFAATAVAAARTAAEKLLDSALAAAEECEQSSREMAI